MRNRSQIRLHILCVGAAMVALITPIVGYGQAWCGKPFPQTGPGQNPPAADPNPICQPDPDNDCKCKRSPCYTGTGGYTTAATDLQLPGPGLGLTASRRYLSTRRVDGFLGVGWTSSLASSRLYYATYLYASPSTYQREADITLPAGGFYRFTENADGTYSAPQGRTDTLVKNPDGTWDLVLQRAGLLYHFNADGTLGSTSDDYSNTITYVYDGGGHLQQVTDTVTGRYLNVYYGANGRISSIQDNGNRQVQFAYNANGTLATVTDAANRVTTYSYVASRFVPLLTRITDNWGRIITDITYDSAERTNTYTELGETYTYTYTYGGNSAQTTKNYGLNTSGSPWVYTTDSTGAVILEMPPVGSGGAPRSTAYDGNGHIQVAADEVGIDTFYTYDNASNITSVTRDYQGPTAVRFDYTYDPTFTEKPVAIIPRDPATNQQDLAWQAWRFDYYQPGDVAPGGLHHIYRMENDGTTQDLLATFTYDSHGRIVSRISASGAETDFTYDAQENLQSVIAPANNDAGQRPTVTYGYDTVGRITSITDPLGHVTTYTYDNVDRLTTQTLPKPSMASPLSFTTTYSYDIYDPVGGTTATTTTDVNGIAIVAKYDQFGRLIKQQDGVGSVTIYGYAHGLLATVTDANNNVTTYSYDNLRRLTATHFPEGTTETYTYYPDGQIHTKTDRKTQTITYAYDALKRLLTKTYPNASSVAYSFAGQLLMEVSDTSVMPNDVHSLGYDSSYRLTSHEQGARGTIAYQYNPDDTVLSYSVQGGASASFTYYPNGSLDTITWSAAPGLFKYAYTLAGRFDSITMPNGQSRTYAYDDQGRILQISNSHPSLGNLATLSYGYDLNNQTGQFTRLGQRVSVTASVPSQNLANAVSTYDFDQAYRMTQVSYPTGTPFNGEVDSWTYDAIGNRTSSTVNGATLNYSYFKNGSNPLNGQRLASDGINVYTYDANGSMLTKAGSANYTFTWDTENRLATVAGPVSMAFTYDFRNRRSGKNGSASASYLYGGNNLLADIGQADYLFGPGIDEPLAMARGGQVYYYSVDGLGSVLGAHDSTGTAAATYTYDAWGVVKNQTGALANSFGYTGREFGDAGDWFNRARYLSPTIGRFTGEDPLRDLAGPSRFAYVSNNPVKWRDPHGLRQVSPEVVELAKELLENFDTGSAAWEWGIEPDIDQILDSYEPFMPLPLVPPENPFPQKPWFLPRPDGPVPVLPDDVPEAPHGPIPGIPFPTPFVPPPGFEPFPAGSVPCH